MAECTSNDQVTSNLWRPCSPAAGPQILTSGNTEPAMPQKDDMASGEVSSNGSLRDDQDQELHWGPTDLSINGSSRGRLPHADPVKRPSGLASSGYPASSGSVIISRPSAESQRGPANQRHAATRAKTTILTPKQCDALCRHFSCKKYLTPEEMQNVALEVKLTRQQVKTWFQNQRVRDKRQQKSMLSRRAPPMKPLKRPIMMRPAWARNPPLHPSFYQVAMLSAAHPVPFLNWLPRWQQNAARWPVPPTTMYRNPLLPPPPVFPPPQLQWPSTSGV